MKKLALSALVVVIALYAAVGQESETGTAKAFYDQGMRLMGERSFEAALQAFERSAALDARQPGTWANMSMAAFRLKRYDKAESALRAAINLLPTEALFRAELCRALSMQGKHSDALKECEEAVRLRPNSDIANSALLMASRQAGRPLPELVALAESMAARFRESEIILISAADLQLKAKNYLAAIDLIERLTETNPRQPIYFGRLAEAYLRTERDSEALTAARKALDLDPNNPHAHYAMGLIFFELGQHEEAELSFAKVPAGIEELAFSEYYRAVSEARQGKSRDAIARLRALVAKAPKVFEFQLELGNQLISESLYEEAVGPLRKASALKPNDLETQTGLGLALFESASYSEAITVLQEALRIAPGHQVVTMFLNVTRARQQQVPRIEEMKKFASENPDDIDIRVRLAEILGYARRVDEADAYVKEIYARDPKDVKVYQTIAVAYSTAGKLEKAEDAYNRSLVIEPNAAAFLGLANIYAKRGDTGSALRAYEKLIEIRPDAANAMLIYAGYLRDQGKRREALDVYKRSLSLQPSNSSALFQAGILSAKLGEFENALRYLEELKSVDPALGKRLDRFLKLRTIWSPRSGSVVVPTVRRLA